MKRYRVNGAVYKFADDKVPEGAELIEDEKPAKPKAAKTENKARKVQNKAKND